MKSIRSQHPVPTACLAVCWLALTLLQPSPAKAADCESGTQMALAIWKEWGDQMKKGGCFTATAVATVLTEGATAAGAVGMYQTCYDTLTKFEEITKKVIPKWNSLVGNTWATLGPRALTLNTALSGTLVSTGGRVFLTAAPLPANTDEVTLKLKKTGGKGKTSVAVCKVSAHGHADQIWSFTIDAGDDNEDQTWSRTFQNMDGYVLCVHLDCQSVAKKMAYELTATVKEKQKARATVE